MVDIFARKNLLYAALIFILLLILGIIFKNNIRCIYWAVVHDTHCVSKPEPKEVTFFSDSLRIYGDIFTKGSTNSPVIILLHGSSEEGRKAALIQMLGKKYSKAGYNVFAIDFRAYGESDDPKSLNAENFNFANDIVFAVDYIIDNAGTYNIDTSKIYLMGHSFGAGVALITLKYNSKIKKVILLGPPRRLEERFLSDEATEKEEFLERWKEDMKLPYELEYSTWTEVYQHLDINNYISDFNVQEHIPIFLIDGENEDKNDRDFLKKVSKEINQPIEYWTIPESDHYLNIKYLKNKLVYSGNTVKNFIERTDSWLKQ